MRIEKYLILNRYLLSLFGVEKIEEIQEQLKHASYGPNQNGETYYASILASILASNLKKKNISKDKLLKEKELFEYDKKIQSYVKKISKKRGDIDLKYFQYLAVLFTEIVLDKLKNQKKKFLDELNKFIEEHAKDYIELLKNEEEWKFKEEDLNKLAFWMATGSGKTLIMHINYYQFMEYKPKDIENILLITPNAELSKQHEEELEKSGIPRRIYRGNSSENDYSKSDGEVLIIEITKLVEEKSGGGVTIPVKFFEGENLVFVDEGHKGKRSEEQKWAKLRKKLGEKGFTFEYSATFGQILDEKNKDILKEYAKAIVFNYSYKYFYKDGYGKDFFIFNLEKPEDDFEELMFIANLLAFYEQVLVYEENIDLVKKYNIEKPLWIFVGTTVTGKNEESDIVKIVKLINKALSNESWVKDKAEKILNMDIFENRFEYLRERLNNGKRDKKISIDQDILDDLYKRVFGGKRKLLVYLIEKATGEFGLKAGENEYFGVINIGNPQALKRLLKEQLNIEIKEDVLSESLFDDIKKNSKINILIGSKKFIEGWDTWRVSCMGLINIGKEQGPQIIQLFGRGVRLKGENMSLKRSNEDKVKILETLNIFAIKSDYLEKFLKTMEKEEVEWKTIEVPIIEQHKDKWEELYILKIDDKKIFEENYLDLDIDETIRVELDLSPKISVYRFKDDFSPDKPTTTDIKPSDVTSDFKKKLHLLNWQKIYAEMLEFKRQRGYWNLVFKEDKLIKILLSDVYRILAYTEEDVFKVKDDKDIEKLEDIAMDILKRYMDRFYRKKAKEFETENLTCVKLNESQLKNYVKGYTVKVEKTEEELIKKIEEFVKKIKEYKEKIEKYNRKVEKYIQKKDCEEALPCICIEQSLYLPLLIKPKSEEKGIKYISPAGLVESEVKFIKGIREYLKKNNNIGFEVYLLRNHPFSGVGFQLKWSQFYPDFIMWLKDKQKQIIVFIEPHGLKLSGGLDNEEVNFAKKIKEIEEKLNCNDKNIVLEYFLLSATSYYELVKGQSEPKSKEELEKEKHLLFLEDENWADEDRADKEDKDRADKKDKHWAEKLFNYLIENYFNQNAHKKDGT